MQYASNICLRIILYICIWHVYAIVLRMEYIALLNYEAKVWIPKY